MRNTFCVVTVATLILLSYISFAQSHTKGKVVDTLNTPMPLVSVTFLSGNTIVVSTLTDKSGSFDIPATLFIDSSYTLKLTSIGYQDLIMPFVYEGKGFEKSFCLKISKNVLQEVKVTA